jgi:hypothetical protein
MHLQFSLDSGRYDNPQHSGRNGKLALRLGVNGFYSPAYRPTITYEKIPAGRHWLRVLPVDKSERAIGGAAEVHFVVR